VPIGSRVPTKNPNRFEVDPQPEPDQAVLVQREMDFCLIGVNRKWETFRNFL
jgi:hypothetical protein